jgi:hypothetical protein
MRTETYESESGKLTIGTVPGCDIQESAGLSEAAFISLYQSCAESVFESTGVYISANVSPARAVYRAEWGCPASGEPVFELRGVRNPMFCEKAPYFDALRMLTERLKAALKQSTAYLEYAPTRFDYYMND